MKKLIWKILKILFQLLLVIILVVTLARINYLPVLVPDSWKEWIIDTTDVVFAKSKFSNIVENVFSLKFLDSQASQNEIIVSNQKNNFKNFLNDNNEFLNRVVSSYEVILSLSGNNNDFNQVRSKYYLESSLNNSNDFDAFLIWDIVKQKFVVKSSIENYTPDENVYVELAKKIDYDKITQYSKPIVFFRDKHVVIVYPFKGDTLGQKGLLLAAVSNHFFTRDVSVLSEKTYFNYVFYNKKLVVFNENKSKGRISSEIKSFSKLKKYRHYFRGENQIMPKIGYRISAENFKLKNPLIPDESISVVIGLIYPKNTIISIVLNILLLGLLVFGIFVIIRMYSHLKGAYVTYRRLKEAPFILLDDTLNKMSNTFDKIVSSTKRIKTNVDRQRGLSDKFMEIAPPKAIGYENTKKEEKKETYGFVSEEENEADSDD